MATKKWPLYVTWTLVALGTTFDMGYEQVQCVNGFPVECEGVDFTNLGAGIIGLILLASNWSEIKTDPSSGWRRNLGPSAAVVACITLLTTAFDGVGCICR